MIYRTSLIVFIALNAAFFAGCSSVRTEEETAAQERLKTVEESYRPNGQKPTLRVLRNDSASSEFLHFALLNHPRVEAAFYDWQAAVLAIPSARGLPDPQLTFQADIADTVMSVMPGLMFDFMANSKRGAMGRDAAASSMTAYRAYTAEIIKTAAELRKAWVELLFVEEATAIRQQMLGVLDQSLASAQADYSTGRGMATLEDQTKVLNASEKLKSDLAVLSDRRVAARARFKAALGLHHEDPDPAWPTQPWPDSVVPSQEELWTSALKVNPSLASMRAMIDMAVAEADVARTRRTPDFTAGLMADVKANPIMYRPTATVTLPIWRSKIRAAMESADARRKAAEARLSAEQIGMASELAQMLFMIRESERMLDYIEDTALPNITRSLRSAEGAYSTGMADFRSLAELSLMELDMQLERVDVRRERELALADLAAFVAAEPYDSSLLGGVNGK
jgi:outer membrane protein TolC